MIVMKFGGSSVDGAAAIERVAGIVRDRLPRQPVVVVSAMAKTTNRLLEAAAAAAAGDREGTLAAFDEIETYHRRVSHGVVPPAGRPALEAALDATFNELRTQLDELLAIRALTPRAADAVASFGEILSSTLLAFAFSHSAQGGIDAAWVDCRRVIVTDHDFTRAKPLYGPTDARLRETLLPLLRAGRVPVLGGYVGATLQGVTTTLGKEGSDFSTAIVGAALGADEILIWTDVDGMRTADPRIFPDARRVRTLSFAEALELSCSGAKKPHYGTLGPASRANVPIRILDSRNPGTEGTVIGRRNPHAAPTIKSITCRRNAHLISARGTGEVGDALLGDVFEVCERFRPSLLVLGRQAEGGDLALDREDRLAEIHAALLSAVGNSAELWVTRGRPVVSLVSEDLATHPELLARVLEAGRDFEPRLVLEGVAAPAVRLLAEEDQLAGLISRLHAELLPGGADEVVE
ncbi:MAG TPA: aspartate kinase [Thermoanaerobaculia bacterium]|jgi:aspartate kinase|nr:aspartate kinase [Thermoanaerobaculia bacterium]